MSFYTDLYFNVLNFLRNKNVIKVEQFEKNLFEATNQNQKIDTEGSGFLVNAGIV